MKKYIYVGVLYVLLSAGTIFAQESTATNSFQQVTLLQAGSIMVPTVVEVPLDIPIVRAEFAVIEKQTGKILPYYYKQTYTTNPVRIEARANVSGDAGILVDARYAESVYFPVVNTQGINQAQITLTTKKPVSSSGIRFAFAPNVSNPLFITIEAIRDDGTTEVVVARKRFTGSTVRFPQTDAKIWRISLEYNQPLRMSEATLVQDAVEKNVQRSLRFLAQPEYTYSLYLNPDIPATIPTTEQGNLRSDTDVLKIGSISIMDNPAYVPSDKDDDGIPDARDNCVLYANPDQVDINGNGRGDVCDDFDKDGRVNFVDNCPNDPNASQRDEDADGIGDACDLEESRLTEKYAWIPWAGMGFAVLVIGAMFFIVMRRSNSAVVDSEDKGV